MKQFNQQETENRRLESENKKYKNDLKITQKVLQSRDRENQKIKNNLQEKQSELQAADKRLNRLKVDNRRLETENKNYEKILAKEEQYNTLIKRKLLC